MINRIKIGPYLAMIDILNKSSSWLNKPRNFDKFLRVASLLSIVFGCIPGLLLPTGAVLLSQMIFIGYMINLSLFVTFFRHMSLIFSKHQKNTPNNGFFVLLTMLLSLSVLYLIGVICGMTIDLLWHSTPFAVTTK